MSQLAQIIESEDRSDISTLISQPSTMIQIDCSGSLSANEIYAFLDEVSAIADEAEKKDRWLKFSHKIRNKCKEMKPRVCSKRNENRFKLSKINPKYEFMFTDGD